MQFTPLTAISPLDGRYAHKIAELRPLLSEYGLIYQRVVVEIKWLQALAACQEIKEIPALSHDAQTFLQKIIDDFSVQDAELIKQIEQKTNHDVKAVEYYLKQKFMQQSELKNIAEFIHFACTSEDINNLAYALMLQQARDTVLLPELAKLITDLKQFAQQQAAQPLLARTHGQAASPTTLGKEFANVVARLQRQQQQLASLQLTGKMNGAVGNFNAHIVAFPNVDWLALTRHFVEKLDLQYNPYTTQIEPHDVLSELLSIIMRVNTILIDFSRDCWGYISLHYLQQRPVANEVGSSTMPHKINPIDFENAEGNLGLANAIMRFLIMQLPTSRWQRDLVDSTLLRNLGSCFAYSLLGYKTIAQGLAKISVNTTVINADLNEHWEVLTEAIQTIMRRYGCAEPYEQLKALSRGQLITQEKLHEFIDTLSLTDEIKHELKQLNPHNYLGVARKLASEI